ncbi:hypothetical protein LOK49_LG04G02340 [Camellia lanceoleosa]|uniref:Uncharacterized protein n=1 Tax=Camellia lanceoleosa TaxID=1840588 RepID=A0ACC0I4Y7_9ERIC|nr:hypothetical protein LOK49_LG04G02340 [Camellia lanceoleosa]
MERLRGVLMSIEIEDDKGTKGQIKQESWGSHEQQAQPSPQEIPTNSWYPPFVVSSPSSPRPITPSSTSFSSFSVQRPADRPESPSHVLPAEVAGIIILLKDKRHNYYFLRFPRLRFVRFVVLLISRSSVRVSASTTVNLSSSLRRSESVSTMASPLANLMNWPSKLALP